MNKTFAVVLGGFAFITPALASAACETSFNGGALAVACAADDPAGQSIDVTCSGASLIVTGSSALAPWPTCAEVTSITINGGPGPDLITLSHSEGAPALAAVTSLVVDGGDGDDTINFAQVNAAFVGLNTANSVSIYGGGGDDYITGTQFGDLIRGGGGDDRINGSLGNDDLNGEDGEDNLGGDEGNDTIREQLSQLRQNADPQGSEREQDHGHIDGDSGVDLLILEGTDGDEYIDIVPYIPPPPPATVDHHLVGHFDMYFDAAHTQRKTVLGGSTDKVIFDLKGGNDHFSGYYLGTTAAGNTRLYYEVNGGDGDDTVNFDYRCGGGGVASFGVESITSIGGYAFTVTQTSATTAKVTVVTECTGFWQATSEAGWITVDTPSGNDAATFDINLTLAANELADARTGVVDVNGFKVNVEQAGFVAGNGNTPPPTNGGDTTPPPATNNNNGNITPEDDPTPTPEGNRGGCNNVPASGAMMMLSLVAIALRRMRSKS